MRRDFRIEETPEGRSLVVTGAWSAAAERAMHTKGADGLVLNHAHGFNERDLGFLRGLRIRRLDILDRSLEDLTPIHALGASLEFLAVEAGATATLDLNELPNLTSLWSSWRHVSSTIDAATELTEFGSLGYAAADLLPLSRLTKLTTLRMKHWPSIQSLDGLGSFPLLAQLEIVLARRLRDFSALRTQANSSALRVLTLDSCGRLDRLDDLVGLTELTSLNIGNCQDIESLHPLLRLTKLEQLFAYESTVVLDGDLSPLLALPALTRVRMASRKRYQPSTQHVDAALAARSPR
ncbi:leucine-rich repeat domain-containing protein [Microterricola viridarii]|uniref:Internalin A n=1 Tax=Microterricola viridarii TaxID=412690 RepID=A0A1H1ZDH3_9MICO|nr:hypothetical protein [Microterricola viridarii]SDT31607.1 internalin A [Microterricola viridarii]